MSGKQVKMRQTLGVSGNLLEGPSNLSRNSDQRICTPGLSLFICSVRPCCLRGQQTFSLALERPHTINCSEGAQSAIEESSLPHRQAAKHTSASLPALGAGSLIQRLRATQLQPIQALKTGLNDSLASRKYTGDPS